MKGLDPLPLKYLLQTWFRSPSLIQSFRYINPLIPLSFFYYNYCRVIVLPVYHVRGVGLPVDNRVLVPSKDPLRDYIRKLGMLDRPRTALYSGSYYTVYVLRWEKWITLYENIVIC